MANRLIGETSPYLLQHAHNPVDWFPWGEEALAKAKAENKVILVSIGYSACHWCHVMERESFENADTAAFMNDHFVNIKIDREERPDLDQIYMDAVQLISGSGGWPLNCFLTPEAKPFYGGTYFPPVTMYNRSSWLEVLQAISKAWVEKPQELLAQATSLTDHLQKNNLFGDLTQGQPLITAADLDTIEEKIMENADTSWGGFGKAPKFPQTFTIQFLIRQAYYKKDKERNAPALLQAQLSLDKMLMGGIYDHLAGGFARYSTDAEWLAPHFEKMLYDNALLVSVLCEAYQFTGEQRYKEVAEQTLDFVSKEWQDADGGFFSAYDADSEGIEGKYYTWHYQEIKEALNDPELLELFSGYYDVSESGNWEHTNILWVQQPLDIFCQARGLNEVEVEDKLEQCRDILLKQRKKRIKPLLDDKKLLSWNALMITAYCKAFASFKNSNYLTIAEQAASFIEQNLQDPTGEYHHNFKDGKAANPAFLEDYACYIQSLIFLQECTGDTQYLENAARLTNKVLADFFDTDSGFFFYTHTNQADVIFRKKEMYDGATPSGNSIMAINLFYLGSLLNVPEWKAYATHMAGHMNKMLLNYPGSFGNWAMLYQWITKGIKEIAVVGSDHQPVSSEILGLYIPDKVFQHSASDNDLYPLLKERLLNLSETQIFLCEDFSCQKPVKRIQDFKYLLERQEN